MGGTRLDRGATSPERLRRQLQNNAINGPATFGSGFVYNPDDGTVSLGLATDPALEFLGGLLSIKLADDSGLSKDTDGLTIELQTTPGLTLGASGIAVLLDPTEPGLQLDDGLKVLLAADGGLELASGLKINLDGGTLALGAGGVSVGDELPKWRKYTVGFADFAAAALENDIELLSLPARGIIHAVKIKHSEAFAGGSINGYTIEVGIVGTLDKYAGAFDVFQAVGDTVFQVTSVVDGEDHGSATSIRAEARSIADNLDQATAGSADIWVLYSVPPA